jgi:choline-glycine betaine transporter
VTHDRPSENDPHKGGALPGSEAGLPGQETPQTDRIVFGVTAALTLAFVIWGATATDSLESVSTSMLSGLMHNGGWAFMLAASGFVVFALWLAISRYGRIRLGAEGEEPEFRTVSWVAMMFSAGMGIGLMFYGVSEPLSHYSTPPPGTDPADSGERMETAMATTLFHWTLHPWAIYAVVGLAIAYSTARPSAPSSPRSSARSTRTAPPAGSSTSSRSSPPSSAPPPRWGSAPSRSAPVCRS